MFRPRHDLRVNTPSHRLSPWLSWIPLLQSSFPSPGNTGFPRSAVLAGAALSSRLLPSALNFYQNSSQYICMGKRMMNARRLTGQPIMRTSASNPSTVHSFSSFRFLIAANTKSRLSSARSRYPSAQPSEVRLPPVAPFIISCPKNCCPRHHFSSKTADAQPVPVASRALLVSAQMAVQSQRRQRLLNIVPDIDGAAASWTPSFSRPLSIQQIMFGKWKPGRLSQFFRFSFIAFLVQHQPALI